MTERKDRASSVWKSSLESRQQPSRRRRAAPAPDEQLPRGGLDGPLDDDQGRVEEDQPQPRPLEGSPHTTPFVSGKEDGDIPTERLVYNRTVKRVIGYVRVSTTEQATNGASLEAQRQRLRAECEARGWELVRIEADEGVSATAIKKRLGYAEALRALKKHEADGLVATKVDRVARSALDFASLLETASKQDWQVVILEGGLDTTTPYGKAFAQVAAVFAELERDLIRQRTREALAVKAAQGVRLGRPQTLPSVVVERIDSMRSNGSTLQAIADALNEDQVPTAQGGEQWWPATVRKVLLRSDRARRFQWDEGDTEPVEDSSTGDERSEATAPRLPNARP